MQNNPLWINVTELMQNGAGTFMVRLLEIPDFRTKHGVFIAISS